MKNNYILTISLAFITLPMNAQFFNFSLRSNNQQLIDEAMKGAFVKINQSYELCDTITNEHFGRNGKDYFSIIPFVGIETERGLILPITSATPWMCDIDYEEYKGQYKPLVTSTQTSKINKSGDKARIIKQPFVGTKISKNVLLINDSTQQNLGLKVDTISGNKEGWVIWLSSNDNLTEIDSVRFSSIKKDIDVPIDGESMRIDKPDISEAILGGIYVTPIQSSIGQITFILTGVIYLDNDDWVVNFPFIRRDNEVKALTPINSVKDASKLNNLTKRIDDEAK